MPSDTRKLNPYTTAIGMTAIVSGLLGLVSLAFAFAPRSSSQFEPAETGPLWLQVIAVLLLLLAEMAGVAWLLVSAVRWRTDA